MDIKFRTSVLFHQTSLYPAGSASAFAFPAGYLSSLFLRFSLLQIRRFPSVFPLRPHSRTYFRTISFPFLIFRLLFSVSYFPFPRFRFLFSVSSFPFLIFRLLFSVSYFPFPLFCFFFSVPPFHLLLFRTPLPFPFFLTPPFSAPRLPCISAPYHAAASGFLRNQRQSRNHSPADTAFPRQLPA